MFVSWKARRQIMGMQVPSDLKVTMLGIIDLVDWSTGQKTFTDVKHYHNWCNQVAKMTSTNPEKMADVFTEMCKLGFCKFDGMTLILVMPIAKSA